MLDVGCEMLTLTVLGGTLALITFNGWYVIGYPVDILNTTKFVALYYFLRQPVGVLTGLLKLAVNTPVMNEW